MVKEAILLEDEGINPELPKNAVIKESGLYQDPFAMILDTIASIRTLITNGQIAEAKNRIKGVKTMISMGLSIADSRKDAVLIAKMNSYKPLIEDLERQLPQDK